MERAWNDHLKSDSMFNWFKKESEASRCQFAWEWLVAKRPSDTAGKPSISNYNGLLNFFDGMPTSHAEKKLDVIGIQRLWTQQQSRDRKKESGVSQYNFWLSDQTISDLDALATRYGFTRHQIIATLIRCETMNNKYLPEVGKPSF
jgi:hypothetical protein